MKIGYMILSYRVMWRYYDTEEWAFEDFSTEEKAFELFYDLFKDMVLEVKMLKIQAVESWY